MSDLALYGCSVLIWGSTWLAIKFQLGTVPAAVSVTWRFAVAALILLAYARIKRLPLHFDRANHAWLALQGLLLFGINYVLVYVSEQSLVSGLVAVIFSLVVFCNIVGLRVFFGMPISTGALAGAALGVVGVALIFWPELTRFTLSREHRFGVAMALAATLTASLGNMTATRNQRRRLPIIQANAWAMLYGAAFVALYALLRGDPFTFERSLPYVVSLLYLALFGSVIAFVAYLTLLGRIGADRASYTAVAIPVIALLLSSLFENLRWDATMVAGVLLCLIGNVLVLRRPATAAAQ